MKKQLLSNNLIGSSSAFGAFIIWGFYPIFFALLNHISPDLQLPWRIIWSLVIFSGIILLKKSYRLEIFKLFQKPKQLLPYIISSTLIASNWYLYVYATTHERVLDISLAFYISPITNIAIGWFVLHENMSIWKKLAVSIVFLDFIFLTIGIGTLPLLAIWVGLSFSIYCYIHKQSKVSSIVRLWTECTFQLAPAIIYLIINPSNSSYANPLTINVQDNILLICSGLMTVIPYVLFAYGSSRIPLVALGFIMYIEPSLNFLIAIFIFKEPINIVVMISFIIIWCSLSILTLENLNVYRKNKFLLNKKA